MDVLYNDYFLYVVFEDVVVYMYKKKVVIKGRVNKSWDNILYLIMMCILFMCKLC